jgi:hypothetical protein
MNMHSVQKETCRLGLLLKKMSKPFFYASSLYIIYVAEQKRQGNRNDRPNHLELFWIYKHERINRIHIIGRDVRFKFGHRIQNDLEKNLEERFND